MRRTILALLCVMLATGGAAFGLAYWLRCRACAVSAKPGAAVHDAAWLQRELNLTSTQAGQVQALEKELHAALGKVCEQHCAARAQLAELLSQPQIDAAAARACVDRMCAAETASERATLEHILKVRAVLTPDQQRQYSTALKTQMSGSCPMRVHQP